MDSFDVDPRERVGSFVSGDGVDGAEDAVASSPVTQSNGSGTLETNVPYVPLRDGPEVQQEPVDPEVPVEPAERTTIDWATLQGLAADFELEVKQRTSWSSDDLLATYIPETRFVVEGLLPEGLTVLGGRPKMGKSLLALQLSQAVAAGAPFLDRATTKEGSVLYLALEDSPQRLRQRLLKQGCPRELGCRLHFEVDWPRLDEDGGPRLEAKVVEVEPALVIIDTISRILPSRLDTLSQGDMTAAFGPLHRLALKHGFALVLVEHLRKNNLSGDPITDVIGSTAKVGVPDTIMGCYRDHGQKDATLRWTGRDMGEDEAVITFDGESLTWSLSAAGANPATAAQRGVVDALERLGRNATAKDVADLLGRDVRSVRKSAGPMVMAGALRQTERRGPHGGSPTNVYHLLTCLCGQCGAEEA